MHEKGTSRHSDAPSPVHSEPTPPERTTLAAVAPRPSEEPVACMRVRRSSSGEKRDVTSARAEPPAPSGAQAPPAMGVSRSRPSSYTVR